MVYPPSPYSSCNSRWHGSGSCRCGNAGHCEKSDCRSVYSGYFLWCISWCNSGNLSWSWSRIWLQLYWNLRIYRSLPYFCTGTDHCKYRRPGKFGPTSACRYSTWKCVQCIFKLCCLYCGRQRWNPDSYFLADGKSGRREMGKSGCDYSLRFYSNPVFLHPEPYSQYDAAWR